MATKIKLMRLGKMRAPYYRIVVADARTKRDGRVIETIGKYHPKNDPSFIEVDAERAAYWLGVGAQATDPVERILKVTGDWQRFKGEAAPPAMLVAEPKADKRAAFEAAARDGMQVGGDATTPRQRSTPPAAPAPTTAPANAPAAAGVPAAAPAAVAAPDVSAVEAAVAAPVASVQDVEAAQAGVAVQSEPAVQPEPALQPEPAVAATPDSDAPPPVVDGSQPDAPVVDAPSAEPAGSETLPVDAPPAE